MNTDARYDHLSLFDKYIIIILYKVYIYTIHPSMRP